MTGKERIDTAKHTLQILDAGHYTNRAGTNVEIAESLAHASDKSILYKPADFENVFKQLADVLATRPIFNTEFEVNNETTLQAMHRLQAEGNRMVALNFASAKNPGGGFMSGAQAQEESLARSSGLYPCLAQRSMMYDVNRKTKTCLYTDHMIYSPDVPFFKNDDGELLDNYYVCSVLTVPAVNAGVVKSQEPENEEKISEVTLNRMEKLLSVAALHQYDTLVLGAWGCGVFRNDLQLIADHFYYHLTGATFKNRFKKVVFAVLDNTAKEVIIQPFRDRFS